MKRVTDSSWTCTFSFHECFWSLIVQFVCKEQWQIFVCLWNFWVKGFWFFCVMTWWGYRRKGCALLAHSMVLFFSVKYNFANDMKFDAVLSSLTVTSGNAYLFFILHLYNAWLIKICSVPQCFFCNESQYSTNGVPVSMWFTVSPLLKKNK